MQLADELVLTFLEYYKYNNYEVASKVVSKARDRNDKTRVLEYINENPYTVMRTLSGLPKYPILFNMECDFPAC